MVLTILRNGQIYKTKQEHKTRDQDVIFDMRDDPELSWSISLTQRIYNTLGQDWNAVSSSLHFNMLRKCQYIYSCRNKWEKYHQIKYQEEEITEKSGGLVMWLGARLDVKTIYHRPKVLRHRTTTELTTSIRISARVF